MQIPEHFLQYIWQHQFFDHSDLLSISGKQIQIIDPGRLNHSSGPDFKEAQIKIEGNLWHGSVEIHTSTKLWFTHKHQFDPRYENVILHVVYQHDIDKSSSQDIIDFTSQVPHLVLEGRIAFSYFKKLNHFYDQKLPYPCHPNLNLVSKMKIDLWLHRVGIEYIEQRVMRYHELLKQLNGDWNHLCFVVIGRYFGMGQNNDNFEILMKYLTPAHLKKMSYDQTLVESMTFGMAGMLQDDFNDDFPNRLKSEFSFLSHKYNLSVPADLDWKYMRSRPANFPTIRLSQLVKLLSQDNLLGNILDCSGINELDELFKLEAHDYWANHYVFDKEIPKMTTKNTGRSFRVNLMVNAVIPLSYAFYKFKNEEEKALSMIDLLSELKSEQNNITKTWRNAGFESQHAAHSQALVYLKKAYCSEYNCLSCSIGHTIVNSSSNQ